MIIVLDTRMSIEDVSVYTIIGCLTLTVSDKYLIYVDIANNFDVVTHGGRISAGLDAVKWAERMSDLGAGEILLTSMDKDGTKSGFNLPLTRAVSDSVPIPVIASGGVGTLDHLVEGVTKGRASAVFVAREPGTPPAVSTASRLKATAPGT